MLGDLFFMDDSQNFKRQNFRMTDVSNLKINGCSNAQLTRVTEIGNEN